MTEDTTEPTASIERGSQATAALQHLQGRSLQELKAKSSFRAIGDNEVALVLPCSMCGDGGLRVVGRVRGKINGQFRWQRVHACDTCGALEYFDFGVPKR